MWRAKVAPLQKLFLSFFLHAIREDFGTGHRKNIGEMDVAQGTFEVAEKASEGGKGGMESKGKKDGLEEECAFFLQAQVF